MANVLNLNDTLAWCSIKKKTKKIRGVIMGEGGWGIGSHSLEQEKFETNKEEIP